MNMGMEGGKVFQFLPLCNKSSPRLKALVFIMLTDFVAPELRPDTGMACLCPMRPTASAGRLEGHSGYNQTTGHAGHCW